MAILRETDADAGSDATEDPFEGEALFQASGWIEADPFPVRATALTDGVVEEVHVLEGESVEEGQILATLVDEDARLALAESRAGLEAAERALAMARAETRAAEAAVSTRSSLVDAARAKLAELEDDARRLLRLGGEAVSTREIRQATLRAETQRSEIAAREAERIEAEARLDTSGEALAMARAERAAARARHDERQLAFERTRVRSPISGVIQRLVAEPGRKTILRMDGVDSATVAVLYRPDRLQARIDVPLEQANRLRKGQPVRLRTNFLPDARFRGEVSRIVGEADLQRNTLQAKVTLLDPDPRLRPEMLCRAEFLAARSGDAESTRKDRPGRGRLYVPTAALAERAGEQAEVWVVGPDDGRLALREIRLGPDERDGHREVAEGLRAGERVVLRPDPDLAGGERVTPIEP